MTKQKRYFLFRCNNCKHSITLTEGGWMHKTGKILNLETGEFESGGVQVCDKCACPKPQTCYHIKEVKKDD